MQSPGHRLKGNAMMHHDNFVVTLNDLSKTPYREYNHKRVENNSSAEVTLPFDEEYQFMFRVRDGRRRRVQITIDGAYVGEVIISANSTAWLERFIEESQKRFKYVKADSEAVPDPDNPDNGKIVVKVWKEVPWKEVLTSGWSAKGSVSSSPLRSTFDTGIQIGGWANCSSATSGEIVFGSSVESLSHVDCSTGATVEGSHSNQSFGTTIWEGDDGGPSIFTFKTKGKDTTVVTEVNRCCICCGAEAKTEFKFCPECGTELTKLGVAVTT